MTYLKFVIASYAAAMVTLGGLLIQLFVDRRRYLLALRHLDNTEDKKQPKKIHTP
ncbi:MAG: heme exporter protein D [Candidatus Tokpelaia sp. JSC085]|nr:MAG: heme exporter protein D [Candidatus Tokpelaia sp. JSC085]